MISLQKSRLQVVVTITDIPTGRSESFTRDVPPNGIRWEDQTAIVRGRADEMLRKINADLFRPVQA